MERPQVFVRDAAVFIDRFSIGRFRDIFLLGLFLIFGMSLLNFGEAVLISFLLTFFLWIEIGTDSVRV